MCYDIPHIWVICIPFLAQSEKIEADGSKVITFSNGTRKVISPDGKSSTVYFFNGDMKYTKPDQTVVRESKIATAHDSSECVSPPPPPPRKVYYYSEFKVTQTNYPDGLEVVEFPKYAKLLALQSDVNGDSCLVSNLSASSVRSTTPTAQRRSTFPTARSSTSTPTGKKRACFQTGSLNGITQTAM